MNQTSRANYWGPSSSMHTLRKCFRNSNSLTTKSAEMPK